MLHYHWLDTSYHINIWGIVDTDNSRGYWNSQNCIGRRIHLDIWTQPSNDLRDCKDSEKKFLLYWMNHQGFVQSHKCIPGLNMNLNMIRNHWFPLKPIICYKKGIGLEKCLKEFNITCEIDFANTNSVHLIFLQNGHTTSNCSNLQLHFEDLNNHAWNWSFCLISNCLILQLILIRYICEVNPTSDTELSSVNSSKTIFWMKIKNQILKLTLRSISSPKPTCLIVEATAIFIRSTVTWYSTLRESFFLRGHISTRAIFTICNCSICIFRFFPINLFFTLVNAKLLCYVTWGDVLKLK